MLCIYVFFHFHVFHQLRGLKGSPQISGWDLVRLWTRDLAPLLI